MGLRVAVSSRRSRFERLQDALLHNDPKEMADALRRQITLLSLRAEHVLVQKLEVLKQEFGDNAARLEVLSPLKTLARGYAIATHGSDGKVVSTADSLAIGERLLLKLNQGQASCTVESINTGNT